MTSQLADVIGYDTRANQPTPATGTLEGALYFVTDELKWERWSGSAWQAADSHAVQTVTFGIEFIIDGGGSAITTGIKGDLVVPFACTITGARLFADQSGSIVIDVWKDTYANYPPTVADTITASAKPTLSSATHSQDTTLTGWTTSVSAGDTIRFNVDSATTVTRVLIELVATRSI